MTSHFALLLSIKRFRLNWVRFGEAHSHMGSARPSFHPDDTVRCCRVGAVVPKTRG